MDNYIPPIPPTRLNTKHNRKPKPLPENCSVDQPDTLPQFSRKIELSRGLFAIVDEDDFEFLRKFNWCAKPDGGTCYAITRDVDKVECKMHRVVMKIPNGADITVDHINHNGLDNRKENLRIVTRSENQMNRRKRSKKKNRFIGVLPGLSGGFTVWFRMPNGDQTKKNFSDEVEAARYYDYLAVTHRGPEVKTNLSKGRFTPDEVSTFAGKITNPLAKVDTVANIKYQDNMVCLTSNEFKKTVNEIVEKDSRIVLLECHIRMIEAELRRLEDSMSNAKQPNTDKYANHLPHQVRG